MGKNIKKEELIKALMDELKLYHFKIEGKVHFDDVDSFGVVHNVKYFYWMEWARTDYFGNIGIKLNPDTFIREYPIMIVHSEADYLNPGRFNDEYEVYSRISFIKDSSVGFENIVKIKGGPILVKAKAVGVHLDKNTHQPATVPDDLKEMILKFENQ
eukprot:Anaeramoba_ignava/a488944_10.p1 GENE.a488944_10~~a488944_10.p1  ORF type:complete len:157 (-),score=4.18 a488944_10:28-498(-)